MTVYRPYCYRTCSDVKTTMFVQWYWHPIHWQSDTRVNQDVLRNWWSFLPIVLYLMGIQGCHPGRHFKIANTVCEFSSIFGRVKLTLNEWEKMKVVIVKMVPCTLIIKPNWRPRLFVGDLCSSITHNSSTREYRYVLNGRVTQTIVYVSVVICY